MSNRFRLAALTGGAFIAFAIPASAQASTKVVTMGEPAKTANTFERQYSADVQDYFPHTVTIHAGDSVKWLSSFHTVDIPARGQKPLDFVVPNGPKPNGVNDQAGNPFWFNGKVTQFGFNPAIIKVATKGTYTGKKRFDSGVDVRSQKPKPVVVKFTKPGTYTYFCDIHPGMKGVVKVVAKGAKVPSASADKKAVAKQLNAALAQAKLQTKRTAPTNTVLVGGGGKGNVEYYGFTGPAAPIAVGTTLKFQMGPGALEVHTATTDAAASAAPPAGPPDFSVPSPYLQQLASTFQGIGPFDPIATFPSDPAGGTPAALTSSSHGNGFWNSGTLDDNKSSPLPDNASVTFSQAGEYHFYCLIHPFMELTVKVQ